MDKIIKFFVCLFLVGAFMAVGSELIDKWGAEYRNRPDVDLESLAEKYKNVSRCAESCSELGNTNGRKSVDLGLPSGNLWAEKNLGADSPERYGMYVAWGELGKSDGTSRFYEKSETKDKDGFTVYREGYTKYVPRYSAREDGFYDDLLVLMTEDDAANHQWGGSWRMPTPCDFDELLDWCVWEVAELNGTYGFKATSRVNGNWIFFPSSLDGTLYWTNRLSGVENACALKMSTQYWPEYRNDRRTEGWQIRPVCPVGGKGE